MKQSRKTKKNHSAGAWLGAVIFLSVLTTGCASNRLHQGARELTGNLPEEKWLQQILWIHPMNP